MAEQKLAGTYITKEQKDKNKERQDKASAMQQAYGVFYQMFPTLVVQSYVTLPTNSFHKGNIHHLAN